MQTSNMRSQLIKVHPLWWAAWTVAHGLLISLCFLLAGIISYLVVGESDAALPAFGLLLALIGGISLGLGQYGLLRVCRIVPPLGPWLAMTIATLILGTLLAMSTVHSWMASGLIIGGLVALGQWVFLRATLHAAGWWIVVTLIPWMFLTAAFNSYSR